jgi:hypothetical protein
MAKQSIANPVVSLGLDSSGLRSGIASSMSDVKNVGSKIGQSLKQAIGTPLSLAGSAAAMAVPLNAALNIANMAASAAKSVLTAPVNALMGRESFLAEQRGMPLLEGSDAGYSGVFARLGAQWNDLLADMMVALDKAFDFRGWIEYARGAMAAISSVFSVFLGPLQEITQNPKHLEEMFRAGGEMLIDVFETGANVFAAGYDILMDVWQAGADIFVDVYNSFVGLVDMIAELKPAFAKMMAGLYNFGETAMMGGQLGDKGRQTWRDLQVQWGITDNKGNPLKQPGPSEQMGYLDLGLKKLGVNFGAILGGTARALFAGTDFAPQQINAADAGKTAGRLIPIMERMAQSRLSSALTSDSTALVEAVTRASVTGPGQDLQQRVAMAAEENVRIAKATQTVQQKILDAYLKSDAYKNNPDIRI